MKHQSIRFSKQLKVTGIGLVIVLLALLSGVENVAAENDKSYCDKVC